MSLFYNPKTRKAKTWVFATFIIIPIIVIILSILIVKNIDKKHKKDVANISETDIFAQP